MYDAFPFMQLPSLEIFSALRCKWSDSISDYSPDSISDSPPGTSSISTLSFNESFLTADAARTVVHFCKALKTFSFTFGRMFSFAFGRMYVLGQPFTAHEIVQALQLHKSTLENLRLDLNENWIKPGWDQFEASQIMAGSLRNFQKLTTLEAGQQSLLGFLFGTPDEQLDSNLPRLVEILPASLESVTILYCDHRIESHLLELAQARRDAPERFPHLKTIDIALVPTWRRLSVNEDAVERAFHPVRIMFRAQEDGSPSFLSESQ
jgi:hypothetical protein